MKAISFFVYLNIEFLKIKIKGCWFTLQLKFDKVCIRTIKNFMNG